MSSSYQIKIGAILSYLAIAFNMVMGIIYTPWMIQKIGQADYGIYGIASSVIALCSIDFGLGQAVSRFVAKYQAEGNENAISGFLGIAMKAYLCIDITIITALSIVFFLLDRIYVSLTSVEIEKLRQVFVILIAYTAISFPLQILNGVITARERFVFQKAVDLFNKFFTVFFVVMCLLFGGGLFSLVLVNSIIGVASAILKLIYLKANNMFTFNFKVNDRNMIKEVFSFSIWVTFILLLQRLLMNISPSILGAFSGTTETSIFTAGATIEGYAYSFTGAISGLFLARVSNLLFSGNKDIREIESLLIRVGRIQLLLVGAVFSIFVGIGKEFVNLWLGESFAEVYVVVILLISPLLITSTLSIAETALAAVGKLQYRVISLAVASGISIALSLTLTKTLGAIGVSIGVFCGYVLGDGIVRSIIYKKVLGLDLVSFYKSCHLQLLFPIAVTIIIGIIIQQLEIQGGWGVFILKGLILTAIYLSIYLLFCATEEEKELISKLLKRKQDG